MSVARDRAAIRARAFDIIKPGADNAAIVQQSLDYINKILQDNSPETVAEMPFWTRLNYEWNPRRVGPGTVLEHGSHPVAPCQTHCRLMMTLLEAHGLAPRAIALHDSNLRGCHGIIEVDIGDGKSIVVDAQYGILYRHPDGRPASLDEIRRDPELAYSNQLNATRFHNIRGRQTQPVAYPFGVDGYTFDFPAYCNFRDFGPLRWKVRDWLTSWFGEKGTFIPKWPNWYVVWPAYNLAFAVDALAIGIIILMLIRRSWRRRRDARFEAIPSVR